jgi:hypothetical protein
MGTAVNVLPHFASRLNACAQPRLLSETSKK